MAMSPSTVSAGSITEEDRRRAEEFIASDQDSVLAIMLQRVLMASDRGADIGYFAEDAEVTPNQAAELLKMSRPHLLSFMDRGDLPFHRVGTHRRIMMADLREFMAAREAGAEIVANALNHVAPKSETSLSSAELDELDSL